jgi:hypothetical protein
MMEINNSAPMPNIEQEGCLAYVPLEQEGTDMVLYSGLRDISFGYSKFGSYHVTEI